MSDTVIYNGVSYDVEKILMIRGEGARVKIDKNKQTNVEQAVCSDKTNYPIVVPVGDTFFTLIKPAVEAKNSTTVFVLSKFILKKLRDVPVTPSRLYNSGDNQVRPIYRPPAEHRLTEQVAEQHYQAEQRIRASVKLMTAQSSIVPQNTPKLTGIEVLRERARIQQQEYQHQQRSSN